MSVLRTIEQKIEGLFEGMFGRAFRTHVQPVELARKLTKEMDDHRMASVSRTYAPNEFTLYLSSGDRTQFADYEASLVLELQDFLAEHARRESYVLLSPPTVTIETDADLPLGHFGIATRMVQPQRAERQRRGSEPVLPPPIPELENGDDGYPGELPHVPEAPPLNLAAIVPPRVAAASAEAAASAAGAAAGAALAGAAADAAEFALSNSPAPPVPAPPRVPPPAPEPAPEPEPVAAAPEPAPPVAPPVPVEPPSPPRAPAAETMVFSPPPPPAPEPAPAPPRAPAAALVGDGARYELTQPVAVMGRSRDCDIVVADLNVSRRHAEVRLEDGAHWLVDLGSTNGTLVNGKKVNRVKLESGDRIEVGSTELTFERTAR